MRRDSTWRSTPTVARLSFFVCDAFEPISDVSLFCVVFAPADVHPKPRIPTHLFPLTEQDVVPHQGDDGGIPAPFRCRFDVVSMTFR